jgi:deferrochelatase/peroxidase EfeB
MPKPIDNTDYRDIQGLLRFGYAKLTAACFLLLRVEDASAAWRWLAAAPISTAEAQNPPPTQALQIAFTRQGLSKLGVPEQILNGFSAEFLSGVSGDDNRSRRLGDIAANSPDSWSWGAKNSVPDVVAMIYAVPEQFEEWKGKFQGELSQSGFVLLQCLPTSDMGGVEPFGFVYWVSSPTIDWERHRDPSGDTLDYGNLLMLGEFVLGYPNEYGEYTTRPLVEDDAADLPDAEDSPGMKDLGRNGTYLVIRDIEQDVRGFWRFLDQQANGDSMQRERLAESMLGRKMSGDSLIPSSSRAIEGVGPDPTDIQQNQFTFDADTAGLRCPFGAHIRRANPRNADLPPGTTSSIFSRLFHILALDRLFDGNKEVRRDLIASTRFHRVLRRGREYGIKLTPEQRLQPAHANEPPTGLIFICLNANIGRQFEFVQSAWLMNTKFDGLFSESDPMLGNRQPVAGCPASGFSLPQASGLRRKLHDVPSFTTIRGGAYFFLPGLRALRYLARIAKV